MLHWVRSPLLLTSVLLTMLVSGCASGLSESDLSCSPEYRAALGQLVDSALEASDGVVLATDKVISLHDAICG